MPLSVVGCHWQPACYCHAHPAGGCLPLSVAACHWQPAWGCHAHPVGGCLPLSGHLVIGSLPVAVSGSLSLAASMLLSCAPY